MRKLDFLLVAIVASAFALMSLMFAGPAWMNADTAILPVMSIQRVTLFYWGQNRFLNLVPALASPVRDPEANLILQVLVFGAGFVGLFALLGTLMARFVLRSSERLDAWLCFALLLALFVTLSSPYALHVFVSEGQPYGLSCFLVGLGLLATLAPGERRKLRYALGFLAMTIAGGLNPSLLLVAAAICGALFAFLPALRWQAFVTFIMSVVAIGLWLVVAKFVPGPDNYGKFLAKHVGSNLSAAFYWMRLGLTTVSLAAAAGASGLAWLILALWPRKEPRIRWFVVGACLLFAVVWFALFSQNAWIVANQSHFRYFYPVFICIPVALTAPLAAVSLRFGHRIRLAVTVVALAATFGMLLAPWRPIDAFPVFAKVKGYVREAESRDIDLIAGSYWAVWPSVFLMLRDGPAFGIELDRGVANRQSVLREIEAIKSRKGSAQALCVDADPERCVADATLFTSLAWRTVPDRCGERCSIIETADER